jgi:hypothetical protein
VCYVRYCSVRLRPSLCCVDDEGIEDSSHKFQSHIQDANERKRERERARYAAMSTEKRWRSNRNVVKPNRERKVIHPNIFRFYAISFLLI